ncbi:hypothetical protein CANCADRAFT_2164 [Tortispora caseinolytica NRRL Y-17796]|uniref:Alpha N-terminal protein methyltransferase 1 n=1 Tax=Tortispora caseinolytica NRRL Y-17796 TaxID=767744 RepID=A0A1E4TFA4_9ASCO|nr:hypothetical protein CANCADRAFT_2164 [Tortispora caseinolytica NRRL Y-17796]
MADESISYSDALDYWSNTPATVDGVLGGFGNTNVPRVDIIGSKTFLRKHSSKFPGEPSAPKYACDIGAGIGRITKNLLIHVADRVDLLEPAPNFCAQIENELEEARSMNKIGEVYQLGMQDFVPQKGKYWLIWCQWCLGQLPDTDLVMFLQRCAEGLQANGAIIVKENISTAGIDSFDDTDSSVTRTLESFHSIFQKAGLKVVAEEIQRGFPDILLPVKTFALVKAF